MQPTSQPMGSADVMQPLTGMQGMAMTPNPSFDVNKFIENNRIHVEHGSLILSTDPLLPIHPAELAPEKEAGLRKKIRQAYTIDGYSFFDSETRAAIASALGGLVPLSADTKEAVLGKGITDWIKQLQTGEDPASKKDADKNAKPFDAVISHYLEKPEQNAAVIEFSKNSLGMYLVMQEALNRQGYKGGIAQFAQNVPNAEGLVAKIGAYLGYETQPFLETARTQGVEGVGKLLGLDEAYLREVKQLGDYAEDHKFSVNTIANWQVGRKLPGMKSAGIAEKIEAGADARVNAKIATSRMAVQHQYTVPEAIRQTEMKVVGMLKFLPPELAETLYLLGTEIAYTPEHDLKTIAPDVPAYGFHRRITQHPDDVNGIYQLFVSGKHDAEEAVRVLVHEAHHLLLPNQFGKQEVELIDGLASHDMLRLKALHELMTQWVSGDDQTKAQVVATLNRPEFAIGGRGFSDCIGEAEMLTFYHQVEHAYDRLQIDSEFYHKSGYDSPEARFQEVNSRYAELRYVREREHPNMLAFIVPGLTVAYEQIYMPHVQHQLEDLRARIVSEPQAMQTATEQRRAPAQLQPPFTPPAPVEQTAASTATTAADDLGFTSHGLGARSTIEASTAELQGMLYSRHHSNTVI